MPRPQFSLRTLLWFVVVVAAFFAGAEWQSHRDWKEFQDLLAKPAQITRYEQRADGAIVPRLVLPAKGRRPAIPD
jgi:hypothetical protein